MRIRFSDHATKEQRSAAKLVTANQALKTAITERKRAEENLQANTREWEVFDRVARIVTSTLDIGQVYEKFAQEAKELVDFDRMNISMIDHDAGTVKLRYGYGQQVDGHDVGFVTALGGSQAQRIVAENGPLIRADIAASPEFTVDQAIVDQGLRSSIRAPLVSNGNVIGTLDIFSHQVDAYGPRDQGILERLASQIAPAVENSILFEEATKHALALESIGDAVGYADLAGNLLFVNKAWEEMFGNSANEVLGKPFPQIVAADPENQAQVRESYAEHLTDGWTSETKRVRKGGEHLDVLVTRAPLKDRKGNVTGVVGVLRDITARNRMEEELRKLSRAVEQSPVGVLITDIDGNIEYVNSKLSEISGYSLADLIGKKPGKMSSGKTPAATYERLWQTITSGNDWSGEILNRHKNGDLYWALETISHIRNDEGSVTHFICIEHDITEHKQTVEALRLKTEEQKALFNIASILNQPKSYDDKTARVLEELMRVSLADSATLRVWDEPQGLRLVSRAGGPMGERPEVQRSPGGLSFLAFERGELVIANDYPAHGAAEPSAVAQGSRSMVSLPVKASGRMYGVVTVVSLEPDHFTTERVSLLTAIVDGLGTLLENARLCEEAVSQLEQRELAQVSLRESETRYRRLFDDAPVGYSEVDVHGNITQVNRTELELLGREAQEVVGHSFLEFMPEQEREESLNNFNRLLAGDGPERRTIERTFTRKNGANVAVLLEVRALHDETGRVVGFRRILQDITERKQVEERMRETGRLAAIGELAAGVAHEINNPLTAVMGYAELLSAQDLPVPAQDDIQKIFYAAQRVSKIVKNLLFFAKRHEPDKRYLEVAPILERALELKSYDFKTGNIELTCQLPQDLPRTMVDEHELIQVIINILSNAEQEMRAAHGGGHLVIRATSADDKIKITITDDGPGILAEHLEHIFEPFFTTKEVGKGTGLGLSICYGILRQHGGGLWAESTPGQGATFHIELPVISPEAPAEPSTPDLEHTFASAKHLLVVDDEPDIRDLLADSFSLERYTVDLASDGEEAWRKLQARPYDCILLDLKMPGMSGQQLYRLMESADRDLAGRVVFITGDTASQDAQDFIAATENSALSKPFDLLELHRQVRQTLMRPVGASHHPSARSDVLDNPTGG